MATILYLSNQLVQVVEAVEKGRTVKVQNIWQDEAPEGSIINGIITDEEAFLSWVKAFFAKNRIPRKEVTLVINSSQFVHKVLQFPKLKEAELKKMISREFAENRTDETLFTYCGLDTEKGLKTQRILATAVEKSFLNTNISLFRQAGIELVAIESAISSLVKLFTYAPEIKDKTCLIQVLDGRDVISMLFVNGKYNYSQKNRLLDSESPEACQSSLESITDKIMQFMTSQQMKESVETLYLCGEGEKQLLELMPERSEFTGAKVISPSQGVKKKKVDFIYGAGCLLGKTTGISLYKQIKKEQKEQRKRRELFQRMWPALLVLLVCLVISAFMGNTYRNGMKELERLQGSMQEEDTVNNHASYKMSTASISDMERRIVEVETIWNHLMTYPTVNSSVEAVVSACAGDQVTFSLLSFQRDSGILTLTASAKDVRNINGFITALQSQEIFEAVEYSGYTYVKGHDNYNIHVVLCLAEKAGR
ncbi:MAG: hypothetical protein IKY23_04245 [Lachnospiraceae bacterium]|nr:hypothetical protein [Lachnospiraceae bacterium]